jgi:hypothetical protein
MEGVTIASDATLASRDPTALCHGISRYGSRASKLLATPLTIDTAKATPK